MEIFWDTTARSLFEGVLPVNLFVVIMLVKPKLFKASQTPEIQ